MRRLIWILQLACLVLPTAARAQAPPPECAGFTNVTSIVENDKVLRPSTFSASATPSILLLSGKPPEKAVIADVGATWSAANVAQIRALLGADTDAFLVWTQLGQEPGCRYRITLAAQPQAGGVQPPIAQPPAVQPPAGQPVAVAPPPAFSGRAVGRLYRADECAIAGQEWASELTGGIRGVSVLLFDEAGQLCYPPPLRPRQGDAIHVGIFTSDPAWSASRITFQPCMLQSPTPNVLTTGRLGDITTLQSAGPRHRIFAFPVRYCWNSPVAIEITSADGNRRMNYSLEQVTLYRATLHFGTIFTENHDVTFGLRPDGPTTKRVFAQGPVDKGPEYVAALVFYSLPRYFTRGGFAGRDPVADTGWKDRIGGLVGVGLENPTERFVAGFSFEVAAGVNIIGVWDWVETEVLRGIDEGDVFVGEPEDIPTQKEWRQKFVFGLTLDIVYAATAFRR